MGVYIPYKRLPSAYQEVEYIQSSGTQRIDTGLKPTDATFGFKGKVNMTAASGEWNIISINGTSTTDYLYRYSVQGSGTQWQTSNIMTSPSGWANVGTVATGTDYEFSYNYNSDRKFTVNGTDLKTGLTASTYSSYGVNWNIFCAAAGTGSGSYSRYGSFKLYYLQIYQGTTLVRDFLPCYRISDGVIGLYDAVNNTFYTNSGTGTFSKGSDVVLCELKNAYIGEVYEYEVNFVNNSLANLQSEGWASYQNTPSFGANGIYNSSSSNTIRIVKSGLGSKLQNAKRITVESTGICSANSGHGIRIIKYTTGSYSNSAGIYINYNSGSNYKAIEYGSNRAESSFNGGSYTAKAVIDLVNKTYTLKVSGYSDVTGTISDTDVSTIRGNDSLYILLFFNNNSIAKAKWTIE